MHLSDTTDVPSAHVVGTMDPVANRFSAALPTRTSFGGLCFDLLLPIIDVASGLPEKASLEVSPGPATDRSPGAAAFLRSCFEHRNDLLNSVSKTRKHVTPRSVTKPIGAGTSQ